MVSPETLTPRQILSVRCPVCLALPKQKCTLSTGKPCLKTHQDRRLLAAQTTLSENIGQTTVRVMKHATTRTLKILFPPR